MRSENVSRRFEDEGDGCLRALLKWLPDALFPALFSHQYALVERE